MRATSRIFNLYYLSGGKMKKIIKDIKELKFSNIILMVIAGTINAVGVTLFLTPVSLIDGGFSGTAFVLSGITPDFLPLSFFLIVLNFPVYIFAFRKLGITFVIYSLISIAMYSLMAFVFQKLSHFDFSNGSPLSGNDLVLCSVFGGIISGCGSGMTIRFGGAIDGIEVLAVMFSKFLGVTVGTFVMMYNIILYVISGIIFGSWIIPLYSILAYAVGIKVVDFVVEGFDRAKSVMIVTTRAEEIAQQLNESFGRGITVFDAQGFYSKTDKKVIYVVVNRFQISKLKKIVTTLDNEVFLTITEVSDTMGSDLNTFRLFKRKNKNIADNKAISIIKENDAENNESKEN